VTVEQPDSRIVGGEANGEPSGLGEMSRVTTRCRRVGIECHAGMTVNRAACYVDNRLVRREGRVGCTTQNPEVVTVQMDGVRHGVEAVGRNLSVPRVSVFQVAINVRGVERNATDLEQNIDDVAFAQPVNP